MPYKDLKKQKLCQRRCKKKYYQRNKDEISRKRRKYYQENREKAYQYNQAYRLNLLKVAVFGYGGKCLFCGEDRLKALVFHHVNEDRQEHIKIIGKGTERLYKWVIDNNFPDEIILLCGTCHLILHRTWEEK